MKSLQFLLMFSLFFYLPTQGQILKRLGDKVKKETDKAANKLINGDNPSAEATKPDTAAKTTTPISKQENLGLYAAYDFVPGDSVLFFDDLQGEELNEIPSKWILDKGRAEVMDVEGEMMIATRQGTTIRPRMKMPNYLPKKFTIEYDIKYVNYVWQYGRAINIMFANPSLDKNQDAGIFSSQAVRIWANAEASFAQAEGKWPFDFRKEEVNVALKDWKHIAISVNEKSVKVYINQYRILNAQIEFANPSSITLNIDGDYEAPVLIKNFRIMSGGKNAAKQVTTNNEYIARGIQFEKASAILLPESMGEINNLIKLMSSDPAMKFEVAGHTSAEQNSSADANQKLSEARAATVRNKMIEMGVAESRLVPKGFGQTKPIASNDTPEGRATNRRVVFTKI